MGARRPGWSRLGRLTEQVRAIPSPCRVTPGRPVYVVHASDRAVVMGEENLIGSLRQLVTTIPHGRRPMLKALASGGGPATHTRGHSPGQRPDYDLRGRWPGGLWLRLVQAGFHGFASAVGQPGWPAPARQAPAVPMLTCQPMPYLSVTAPKMSPQNWRSS